MRILSESDDRSRMPVAIVSGYLGSGKTTLINQLLHDPRLADTAVAVNEFGEVPLDQHLIEHDADKVVTLANGCLCCNMAGDLEDAVLRLFARRQEGAIPDFSRLIIEPTGLANPVPLAQALLRNPLLSKIFRLETVIVTVDALLGEGQLARHKDVVRQVRLAEHVLLTKTDLTSVDQTRRLSELLRGHNPVAPLLEVTDGQVDAGEIFTEGFLLPETGMPRLLRSDYQLHQTTHEHSGGHAAARAVVLTTERPLSWADFDSWLRPLRLALGENLLRLKGLLKTPDSDTPVVVHGVEHVLHPPVQLSAWPHGDHRTRLVFVLAPDATLNPAQSWDEFIA